MKKMEVFTDKVLKVLEKISRNEVKNSFSGGTPKCSAIYHQPKRPKKK